MSLGITVKVFPSFTVINSPMKFASRMFSTTRGKMSSKLSLVTSVITATVPGMDVLLEVKGRPVFPASSLLKKGNKT